MKATRSAILVVALVALAAAPVPSHGTSTDDEGQIDRIEYVVQIQQVRSDLHENGGFDVELPKHGQVRVIVDHQKTVSQGYWAVAEGGIRDTAVFEPAEVYAVDGKVNGHRGSHVDLFVGTAGIYGEIILEDGLYLLFAEEEVPGAPIGVTEYVNQRDDQTTPLTIPNLGSEENLGVTAVDSKIVYDAEKGFRDTHPSTWHDRITTSLGKIDGMWDGLGINLVPTVWDLGFNVLSGDRCDGTVADRVVNQYRDWLASNQVSGTDAYQLWTARDLKSGTFFPGAQCFGQAKPDQVGNNNQAASVVEGVDVNCCDLIDPDEVRNRAVLSGHEFSHIYGEENHPECGKSGGYYNIMEEGHNRDNNGYWWCASSQNEINARFFSGNEP